MNEPLRAELERLFSANLTDAALEDQLTTLANAQPEAFQSLADVWAIRLYERSPYIFGDFIAAHLTADQRDVVEILLRRAEADSQTALFKQLYPLVANKERWNADALSLAHNAPDYEAIITGLHLRQGDWAICETNNLIALYQRDPEQFKAYARRAYLYDSSELCRPQSAHLEEFRQAVGKREPGSDFYYDLFRRYATSEEWQAAIRRVIVERPENVEAALNAIWPNNAEFRLDSDLEDELLAAFGETAVAYLEGTERSFARWLNGLFQAEPDNAALEAKLREMTTGNWKYWQRFRQYTCAWAPTLYARGADFFSSFILEYADANAPCLPGLLRTARDEGYHEFFRKLVAYVGDNATWNNEILSTTHAELSDADLLHELDRLDVQQERRRSWGVHQIYLADQAATALYKRLPSQLFSFIWRYLPPDWRFNRPDQPIEYPALLEAARNGEDEEAYVRLLRKLGSGSDWEAEMRRLLARELPPDQILAELEKRKPRYPDRTKPAILHAFLEKYGAAVLPFFENYLDWTNPARLTALLDLDIDRATLLHELQTIARRQPQEFAEQVDVWAFPLYERSPEFFGPFIIRNLGWRQSQESVKELLRRAEVDGKEQFFRDLYTSVFTGEAWNKDVARLLRTGLSDEKLCAALDRRVTPWSVLPDDLATELYNRSQELFRPFILKHLGHRFNRVQYKQLRSAAEARSDSQMVEALREITDPETVRAQRMEAIETRLSQGVPFAEIEPQLRELAKQEDYLTKRIHKLIVGLVERYTDEAVPFVLDFIRVNRWRLGDKNGDLLNAAGPHVSPTNFWQLAFLLNQRERWYSALDSLSQAEISEADFRERLAILTPETQFGSVPTKTALALYRRFPDAVRPFLERFLDNDPTPEVLLELIAQAERNGDDTLLDVLTYKMLIRLNQQRSYVNLRRTPQGLSVDHNKMLATISQDLIDRLDRLYAASPETLVQHAAYVLSFLRPFDLGWRERGRPAEDNTLWSHLTGQHRDAWRASTLGITALLESPSIFVQLVALEILASGDENLIATRVLENLRSFRAILLSKMHKETKRQALRCLEAAAHANSDAVARIVALLQETLDFQARRAITTDIAQALVRLKIAAEQ